MDITQKSGELFAKEFKINFRCPAPYKSVDLAVKTTPVTGLVRIQVDANGNPLGAARHNRIDVT